MSCSANVPAANRGTGEAAKQPTGPLLSAAGATAAVGGASTIGAASAPSAIDDSGADNPAGLSTQQVAELQAGGPVGDVKLLYPYDGTVFPRGLLPPTLMWSGADTADAVYLHLQSTRFEYSGVLQPSVDPTSRAPGLDIPAAVWAEAGRQTAGKDDPFTLELSLRVNGQTVGPLRVQLTIAVATVKGSIYYNSYASKLPGAAIGGNVLRIPPGGKAELYNAIQCNGCHTVSADGSKMLSQIELKSGGSAFDILAGGSANPAGKPAGQRVSFAALYPDGSKYLSTSVSMDVAHAQIAEPDNTPPGAALFDSASGQPITDTGIPQSAAMPMFSPDGAHLVFTDAAVDGGDALVTMDYDTAANRATSYRELMRDAETTRPGWPFFLPDAKAVVFVRTSSSDFSGNGAYIGAGMFAALAGPFASLASAPVPGPLSDLYIVDVASGNVSLLARAMGFASAQDVAAARTSLPFGDDTHQSYFPTLAPVAAGGYFWVFFDGIRHYGNRGIQRQLWGFAIDISASGNYRDDHSHPAFYLPGQEAGAGNHRAFAALDPCLSTGASCDSGIDCCSGTCSTAPEAENEPHGMCQPQQNSCARRDERCKHDSDCCPPAQGEPANWCIAGFCAYVPLN